MRILIFLFIISLSFSVLTQIETEDSHIQKNKLTRSIITNSTVGLLSGGSLIALHGLWYSKETQEAFHLFDDSKNWLQMDKFGHAMTTYELSKDLTKSYQWAGMSQNKSRIVSVSIALGYMSAIEIMDGFSSDWGFSISDMAANLFGSGLFLFQETYFSKQIFQPNFSFHPTDYSKIRPEILGNNLAESILKDYNGQTYWICFSPGNLGLSAWPKWLMLSFGHSIDGRLKGNSAFYMGTESKREYLFSLDIDLTEIPVKSKFLKSAFEILNCIKIPFPALIFSNGDFNVSPMYF